MFKKPIETPRKSLIFDGTSIDDVHAPLFNILSQTPSPKIVEIPAIDGSSRSKNQKDKNNEAKESVIPANQKGKKRKGKTLVETPPDSDSNFDSDFVIVEIDAKYHRERYATIQWHYGKTKNEDGAITTGTVASKFGRPRITKEHVPDTTNYPIPRPLTINLK
ncbi:hypothetical protein H5410_056945 [Solanum commersonii]|uniref:Uncharacterized protein n=1 Tax=Solanum commersonii TaxID=4109 RepID=A0A9J5WLM0_SOLCO|nr:hypothetical protein H5410_056945 [Solanum commersonii]